MPSSSLSSKPYHRERERERERGHLEMAKDSSHPQPQYEEDCIDMDINSATFLCYKLPSPPHPRDFEFQKSSHILEPNRAASPADELFYKGNLLPLLLPPRLQMVEKLLQKPAANISPAASCYASGDLSPEDYFACPKEFEEAHKKKPWPKKLTLIKRLKASKDYLKSLFASSGKAKKINGDKVVEEEFGHRRSSNKSSSSSSSSLSSSSSSSDSSSFSRVILKRSSSVSSDKEGSIQAAIAYCKKSQQKVCGRKSVSDVEFLFGARI